jgi:hypothetical protein
VQSTVFCELHGALGAAARCGRRGRRGSVGVAHDGLIAAADGDGETR